MAKVLGGRYELRGSIGRGGMAQVFRAHDRRLDRIVAVKRSTMPIADAAARQRFVREARMAARFTDPHAVTVFDAGDDDGELYIVMELVEGPSLAEYLRDHGVLTPEAAARVADNMLSALAAAHAAGIVHRDVKPANVLLSPSGGAKLTDFGIAKQFDELAAGLTAPGQFIGTPKYLAPEQVRGDGATPASDLYAVGCVLYEMLAGQAPFDEPTPMATAIARTERDAPDVSDVRSGVPAGLAAVVHRAMARPPAERFSTATEMRAAIADAGTAPPTTRGEVQPSPGGVAPTAVLARSEPAAGADTTGQRVFDAPDRHRRQWWMIPALLALAVVVGLAVWLGTRSGGEPPGTTTGSLPVTAPPSVILGVPVTQAPGIVVQATDAPAIQPAVTDAPATETPVTETPVTGPPVTDPPATDAPGTSPPPAEQPGTPGGPPGSGDGEQNGLLDDVPDLSETAAGIVNGLFEDPEGYGRHGHEIARELEKLLDDGGDSERRADKLRENVATWVDDGSLDQATADAVVEVVDSISG